MTGPRLFPDYAALPTATDRTLARRNHQRQQLGLFDGQDDEPGELEPYCPVCGSNDHDEPNCPHGTAPTLPEIRPSDLACDECGRTTYYCTCAHDKWARTDPHRGTTTAPDSTLPTSNPSNPAQVRAMFASFGWATTTNPEGMRIR